VEFSRHRDFSPFGSYFVIGCYSSAEYFDPTGATFELSDRSAIVRCAHMTTTHCAGVVTSVDRKDRCHLPLRSDALQQIASASRGRSRFDYDGPIDRKHLTGPNAVAISSDVFYAYYHHTANSAPSVLCD
jgi:hypothetical protein